MCFLNNTRLRRIIALMIGVILVVGLVGCKNQQNAKANDVLTQKPVNKDDTNITVMVKYAFSINKFEKEVEKRFPGVNIVQVGNYSSEMGKKEYAARLEHNDLTDIVMTWPQEVGEEYLSERFIDLSGKDFTNRYKLSMLNDISKDGKLYYLPGPSQVRGIVYNKTMFEENGWKVPDNFEEFIALCKTIEESGIRALQLGLKNEEVLDTAFIGYSLADCFSKPSDIKWISDYNQGNGSFGDHFGVALDTFSRLVKEGVLKEEDLRVDYSQREKMLFTRKAAMVEDSVQVTKIGEAQTGTKDEFALMPFFNPGQGDDWARLYMVCYIGVNKELEKPQNKKKHDLVMEIMEFISTSEGQEALRGDTNGMFSSLNGVSSPEAKELDDMQDALAHGRYAPFTPLKNAQGALREGLAGLVRGDMTKEQVIALVDGQNINPPQREQPDVYGTATKDFTMMETAEFFTDAMKETSGSDIALMLDNGKDGKYNGGGISGNFYKGDINVDDIDRIMPDFKTGTIGKLNKITMTGKDLRLALEHSRMIDGSSGWFYYFSGLNMEYNPSAQPGSRIRKIALADGSPLEEDKLYSVVSLDNFVSDDYLQSSEMMDVSLREVVVDAIKNKGSISPAEDNRFIIAE